MSTGIQKFVVLALLLSLIAPIHGNGVEALASVQAIRLEGDYLGTYTPNAGNASQLQMFLNNPGAGGAFTGEGNIRVDGTLHPVDIAGTVKRKRGKISFRATLTGTEFNDNIQLTGKLKGRKVSGKFTGTVGGPNVNGKFSISKV